MLRSLSHAILRTFARRQKASGGHKLRLLSSASCVEDDCLHWVFFRLQYLIDGTTSIVSALGFSGVETSDDAFKNFHQKLSSFLSQRKSLPGVPCCFPVLCSLLDNRNELSSADLRRLERLSWQNLNISLFFSLITGNCGKKCSRGTLTEDERPGKSAGSPARDQSRVWQVAGMVTHGRGVAPLGIGT